jgi:hypothetical protein
MSRTSIGSRRRRDHERDQQRLAADERPRVVSGVRAFWHHRPANQPTAPAGRSQQRPKPLDDSRTNFTQCSLPSSLLSLPSRRQSVIF